MCHKRELQLQEIESKRAILDAVFMRNKAVIPRLGNSHMFECHVYSIDDKKWSYLQELDVIFKCLMISNLLCHSGIIKPRVFFTGISLLGF